ncbi:MAG: hypothetical protein KJO31_11045 [Gammaproteobacteria bacterium]|nr:hypothetical protein [Gammaproteobacteria bacterium]
MEFSFALALQLAIAIAAVSALLRGQLRIGLAGLLILFLTFAPAMIERRLNMQLPVEVTLITCLRRSVRNLIRWFANSGDRKREQHVR